jgi:uncharacterized protein YaaW (UPF0174 family)
MPRHDTLWKRLESARLPDLQKLGELFGVRDIRDKPQNVLVEELSQEIRTAAGHFLPNLFRGPHDFPYKQMLIDVADKMAPGWTFLSRTKYRLSDGHSEIEVEETIWQFFEKWLNEKTRKLRDDESDEKEKLRRETEQDLRQLGYSEALVSQVGAALVGGTAATVVGPSLAYSVALNTASGLGWLKLWWVGKASLAATLGASASVFALIYAPVFAWWLGNTAYRKTVPAALHLIQIRKLHEVEDSLR